MGDGLDRVRDGLTAAVGGAERGSPVAVRLCLACVDLLGVDGAGLWLATTPASSRSLAAVGVINSELDRRQLSGGQGPCWDAVVSSSLITATDLHGADADRWPAFGAAATASGIRSVNALPVTVAGVPTGVLYLCRSRTGGVRGPDLAGALLAAELAALPLLDLIAEDRAIERLSPPVEPWEYGSLTRSEVYQAVGMIAAQLGVHPAEAMLRLRGYAFANDLTASEVAYLVIERKLLLEDDGTGRDTPTNPDTWPEQGGEL